MKLNKSEKFMETAVSMLAKEIMFFDNSISFEDSMSLSEEIVSTIDWENEALMHKGFAWIAKNYINHRV